MILKYIAKKHILKNNIIFVSNSVKTQFEKFMNLEVKNYEIINNFIDFNTDDKKEKINDKLEILFVGRLSTEKNIPLLLETMIELKKINSNFHLSIVGDGKLKNYTENYISKNNLNNEITMYGRVENVGHFYKKSDLLFSPSINEGQGIILYEANQYELPVIGCENITFKEFLTSDIGMLVPFDAKVIANVLNNDLESIKKSVKKIDLNKYNKVIKKKWSAILK